MSRRQIQLPGGRAVAYGLDHINGYFGQLWAGPGEQFWLCVNCMTTAGSDEEGPDTPCPTCGGTLFTHDEAEGPIDTTPMMGPNSKSVLLEWFDKHGITKQIPKHDLHAIALDLDLDPNAEV